MKVVVTGATGLLGSATAKFLASQGHEVIGVDRKVGEVQGVKIVVGDISDLAFCDSVIATKSVDAPVMQIAGLSFMHISVSDVVLIAATK